MKGSACSFCHHVVTEQEAQLAPARPRKVRRKRIKNNIKDSRDGEKGTAEMDQMLRSEIDGTPPRTMKGSR